VLSLAIDSELADTPSLGIDQLANGQLLACFLHEAMTRIVASANAQAIAVSAVEEFPNGPIVLSQRELDCLSWSAAGKTSWEIGRILSISERTVNFHIAKAARKLGTYGRRHAISRAMALGLLSP
jgi:DNA-binding CsgD family transcriptional regulator